MPASRLLLLFGLVLTLSSCSGFRHTNFDVACDYTKAAYYELSNDGYIPKNDFRVALHEAITYGRLAAKGKPDSGPEQRLLAQLENVEPSLSYLDAGTNEGNQAAVAPLESAQGICNKSWWRA